MTTDIELLRAIVARPDDDTPRLAYADWLDDSATADNGYAARAEYVRLQIRLAREGDRIPPAERASLEKRRWRLHDDHHREWEQGIHFTNVDFSMNCTSPIRNGSSRRNSCTLRP
jgi:uncharacterized protein (TIGR02996 family)